LLTHFTAAALAQRRHQPELVDRQAHDRAMVDRMRADDEAHGQRLPAAALASDRAQIAGRDQVDAGFAAATEHKAAHANIGPAALGSTTKSIGRRGAVGAVPEMDRKVVRSASSP
jgi:hypothetical protein